MAGLVAAGLAVLFAGADTTFRLACALLEGALLAPVVTLCALLVAVRLEAAAGFAADFTPAPLVAACALLDVTLRVGTAVAFAAEAEALRVGAALVFAAAGVLVFVVGVALRVAPEDALAVLETDFAGVA